MRKKNACANAIKGFVTRILLGIALLGTAYQTLVNPATAQDATTPYPNMAPIEQYLMDRTAEIALARSAAPKSISSDAEVLVLGLRRFETGVKGKNGFVCLVERGWSAASDPDFWNPKVRVPICYNPAAARSFLLRNLKRSDLALAGLTKVQVDGAIVTAVDKKELPVIESGAMCYMMSKQGYGGDIAPHWPAHLMFYFSQVDPTTWGADLPGSPIVAMRDDHEHLTEFVIPVPRWSDGTHHH